MSDAAPTLTEINVLIRNWLSITQGIEGSSAVYPINNNAGIAANAIGNGTYGLLAINNRLTTGLNNQSGWLATLLQSASDQAAGITTLVNRTASGGGGSGFIYDLDAAIEALLADHVTMKATQAAIVAAIAAKAGFSGTPITTQFTDLQNAIMGQEGDHYQTLITILDNLFTNMGNQTNNIIGQVPLLVNAKVDSKGNDVLASIVVNRNANLDHRNAILAAAALDLEDTLGALGTIAAEVNGYTGLRADELAGAITAINAATVLDLADLRTSVDSDNGVRIGDQAAADDLARLAQTDQVIADVNFYTASRANALEAAHIRTFDKASDVQQQVVDLPALIKLDADAQTAYILDNIPGATPTDFTPARDYIVQHGEEQRDDVNEHTDIRIAEVKAEQATALAVLNANAGKLDILLAGDQTGYTVIQDFEVPWAGVHVQNYGADVYQVQVDQMPPGRPRIQLPGDHEYLPHMGWCALRILGGWERGPLLEFGVNTIVGGKLRAEAILIYTKPGTTGVVRGYDYSATP